MATNAFSYYFGMIDDYDRVERVRWNTVTCLAIIGGGQMGCSFTSRPRSVMANDAITQNLEMFYHNIISKCVRRNTVTSLTIVRGCDVVGGFACC